MAGKPELKSSAPKIPPEVMLVGVIILAVLIYGTNWMKDNYDSIVFVINSIPYYFINFFARFAVFSVFFSVGMIILIIIYMDRENSIRKKILDKVKVEKEIESKGDQNIVFENLKWKLVEEHINSDDQNKWKLAILESDIILAEMLDKLSLPGESIGEKLKSVESSDFDTIEQAWEAHKIRNAIAHQGSDFLLNQREAKRVIGLYASVFKEFGII
jgi:hypothetical protein